MRFYPVILNILNIMNIENTYNNIIKNKYFKHYKY